MVLVVLTPCRRWETSNSDHVCGDARSIQTSMQRTNHSNAYHSSVHFVSYKLWDAHFTTIGNWLKNEPQRRWVSKKIVCRDQWPVMPSTRRRRWRPSVHESMMWYTWTEEMTAQSTVLVGRRQDVVRNSVSIGQNAYSMQLGVQVLQQYYDICTTTTRYSILVSQCAW